jgi:hypothetical protein
MSQAQLPGLSESAAGLGAPVSAFERLYLRAPSDAERVRLLNIQRAVGLEQTSEWWVFFLVIDSAAGQVTQALNDNFDRWLQAQGEHLEKQRTLVSDLQALATLRGAIDDLCTRLQGHVEDMNLLADNAKQDLLQSAAAEAASAARVQQLALRQEATEEIRSIVRSSFDTVLAARLTELGRFGATIEQGASLAEELRAGVRDGLKAQEDALAGTADTVSARVVAELARARGITMAGTLRAFGIFGSVGAVLGGAVVAATFSMFAPSPLDDASKDWLQWAISADGQAARRLSVANGGAGGIASIAHCSAPRAKRDAGGCTATFTPLE